MHHGLARQQDKMNQSPHTRNQVSYFKATAQGEPISVAKEWEDLKVEAKYLPNLEIAGYPKMNLSSTLDQNSYK